MSLATCFVLHQHIELKSFEVVHQPFEISRSLQLVLNFRKVLHRNECFFQNMTHLYLIGRCIWDVL